MESPPCLASAIVCTANRGASVVAAVSSILQNTYPNFEVLVVDQSNNDVTRQALQQLIDDSRVRYIRTEPKGLGAARNVGLEHAGGCIAVFTDDDCIVPPAWIDTMTAAFALDARVAVAFCNVEPATYDRKSGFIPYYVRNDSKMVRTVWELPGARGIGAGMAVRREAILALGGFDPRLGRGADFCSGEDLDIALRVLIHKLWVYETNAVSVVHLGFRDFVQFLEMQMQDWFGSGAVYAKPFRCGYWSALPACVYQVVGLGLLEPLTMIARRRRPQGFKRALHFWRGLMRGLITPLDHRRVLYLSK